MQRTWLARLKLIFRFALPVLVIGLAILFDQLTKAYFRNEYIRGQKNFIIPNFFYLTYTVNTGAAWSFLADKWWAQTFFKVLTGVALVPFIIFLAYTLKKDLKWLSYSMALIIGGSIGNFIDRLAFNGVTDFIGVLFWGNPFPIFNLADSFMVVGVIMLVFYYAFLDANAIFKSSKKNKERKTVNNDDKENNQSLNEGQGRDGKEDVSDS